jgi:hypothetical protein
MAASREASSRMRVARASAAAGARLGLVGARLGAAEQALAQGDPAANVIIAVVLEHAVAAGVDAGADLRQPVGA